MRSWNSGRGEFHEGLQVSSAPETRTQADTKPLVPWLCRAVVLCTLVPPVPIWQTGSLYQRRLRWAWANQMRGSGTADKGKRLVARGWHNQGWGEALVLPSVHRRKRESTGTARVMEEKRTAGWRSQKMGRIKEGRTGTKQWRLKTRERTNPPRTTLPFTKRDCETQIGHMLGYDSLTTNLRLVSTGLSLQFWDLSLWLVAGSPIYA